MIANTKRKAPAEVPAGLEDHPQYVALVRDLRSEAVADRGVLVASLRALEAQREEVMGPLAEAKDKRYVEVCAAVDDLEAARQRYAEADQRYLSGQIVHERKIETVKRELEIRADPAIAEFIEWLDDVEARTRNNPEFSHAAQTETLRAIRAARLAARALRYSDDNVEAALAALRATLS